MNPDNPELKKTAAGEVTAPAVSEGFKLPEDLTFESAMSRLEQVVNDLERGSLTLDESLKAFQEGNALARFCQQRLTEVDRTISKLVQDGENAYATEPLDIPEES